MLAPTANVRINTDTVMFMAVALAWNSFSSTGSAGKQMPPAKSPKKPAILTIVRMKRRRRGEKTEYGTGRRPCSYPGLAAPVISFRVGNVGWPMASLGSQCDCILLSPKSQKGANFSGRCILTGTSVEDDSQARLREPGTAGDSRPSTNNGTDALKIEECLTNLRGNEVWDQGTYSWGF